MVALKRWTLNILAGLSLAVFLAIVTLWVRSYWRADNWYISRIVLKQKRHHEQAIGLVSKKAAFGFYSLVWDLPRLSYEPPFDDVPERRIWGWNKSPTGGSDLQLPAKMRLLGFAYRHDPYHAAPKTSVMLGSSSTTVILPSWFLAILFAILPAWRFGGFKRRRRLCRMSHGLCGDCGYDLRFSPERCPECGRISPSAQNAAVPRSERVSAGGAK
jgi:hypothetical protein